MQKHYSLVHAEKVLKAVARSLPKSITKDVHVDCWANGREQGFHLSRYTDKDNTNLEVVFAQQRNSDEVIVVPGRSPHFDITTNSPDEKAWENRKCFRDDADAVFFIIKHLVG